MSDGIAPEFQRFVAAGRRAQGVRAARRPMAEGQVGDGLLIGPREAQALLAVAARRAAGLVRPSKRTEVVWAEGGSELAVSLTEPSLRFSAGLVVVGLAVRCDQTGPAEVQVHFACGAPDRPAGVYVAAQRRPVGPELIVATWGDALVAFAWQCLLGLVAGVAGAAGKDERGNVLVPVEIIATSKGLEVVPMARHRFAGSSGLKPVPVVTRPAPGPVLRNRRGAR